MPRARPLVAADRLLTEYAQLLRGPRLRSWHGVHESRVPRVGVRRGIELLFIRLGNPVENAFIESFHCRPRDECLSANWFLDLNDARAHIDAWRRDYSHTRPHSGLEDAIPSRLPRAFARAAAAATDP